MSLLVFPVSQVGGGVCVWVGVEVFIKFESHTDFGFPVETESSNKRVVVKHLLAGAPSGGV